MTGHERAAGSVRSRFAAPVAVLMIGLGLIALPQTLSLGSIYLAASITTDVLLGLGVVAVVGYGGYFSLAQGVLFGVGAYSIAILGNRWTSNLLLLLLAAAVLGAVVGAAIALTCMRVTHLYLAMVTLAYGFVMADFALNWSSLTGGGQGMTVTPTFFGHPATGRDIYECALVGVVVTLAILCTLRRNSVGRAQALTRMSGTAAQSLGIRTNALMVATFAGGGVVAGISGGLYASNIGFVDPTVFDFNRTVATLTIVVIAGIRSPIAFICVAPPLLYLESSTGNQILANWLPFGCALLVIAVLRIAPRGLGGIWAAAYKGLSTQLPKRWGPRPGMGRVNA